MCAKKAERTPLSQVYADLTSVQKVLKKLVETTNGKALIDDLLTATGPTDSILWQALMADCLRVIHCAVLADGVIEDHEIDSLSELIAAAAAHYEAGPRSQIRAEGTTDREAARAFLDRYAANAGIFGRGGRRRWPGLTLCRKAAELGNGDALQHYTRAMTSLLTEASRIGGVSDADRQRRFQTDELDDLRRNLACEIASPTQAVDRRIQAFLTPSRAFSAVQQASSIYENDPFDVDALHRDARISFAQLVGNAAARRELAEAGQMLLVLGESGAGKTHLLRGFRRYAHENNRGFIVYAQLQSRAEDYSRYLLFHLVESLSKRYSDQSERTGLSELASGLLRICGAALRPGIQKLVDDVLDGKENVSTYITNLANELLCVPVLHGFGRDFLRIMLYALRPDPPTTSSVYSYLRCDNIAAHDRHWIGGIAPQLDEDAPSRMIREIAKFAGATQRALVLMIDQVDLAGFEAESTKIFRRAIDALYKVVSEIPSAVAVIACLSDMYRVARPELSQPALDRLEKSPPVANLQLNRSYPEIEAVVARRLAWLFAEYGTVHRPDQPVYPIPVDELKQQENRRLRDVLEWCHHFQNQCAATGKIINAEEQVTITPKGRDRVLDEIAALWSEAIQVADLVIPSEDDKILAAVAEAGKAYVQESGLSLDAPPHKNGILRLQMSRSDEHASLVIAVTNRNFHGGAFPLQIESLRNRADGMTPVAVRTIEFPRGPACVKAKGQLVNMGGRGVYLDASTLRALIAFQQFKPPFPADRIAAWQLRDRPISSLPAVAEIFDFDRSRSSRPVDIRDTPTAPIAAPVEVPVAKERSAKYRGAPAMAPAGEPELPATQLAGSSMQLKAQTARRSVPRPASISPKQLWVGNSTSFTADPMTIELSSLLHHIGIVDGTGNGRLAAAMNLVEQVIERGIPVVVLDRTGEMSGYARPDWWQRSDDPQRARQLADRLDVRLFTPGIRSGRPLSIALIPDLTRVAKADHERTVRAAATTIAAMLRPSAGGDEAARLTALDQAIGALAKRAIPAGLGELIALLEAGNDTDKQLRERLADDLAALLSNVDVFTLGAESLSATTLIEPTASDRVPLAIINTSFLGDGPRLRAWTTQLISCLSREVAPSASKTLRALVVFDGAELLLPAGTKATAKEPLHELLKRGGAAGLGCVLLSQHPAELDYKRCGQIDTWFVGKCDEDMIGKMKALFEQHPLGHRNLSRLESGRLVMLHDKHAHEIERGVPLLPIEPISEPELKALAAQTHPPPAKLPLPRRGEPQPAELSR